MVGVGSAKPSQDHLEDIDVGRENVRTAAAGKRKRVVRGGEREGERGEGRGERERERLMR